MGFIYNCNLTSLKEKNNAKKFISFGSVEGREPLYALQAGFGKSFILGKNLNSLKEYIILSEKEKISFQELEYIEQAEDFISNLRENLVVWVDFYSFSESEAILILGLFLRRKSNLIQDIILINNYEKYNDKLAHLYSFFLKEEKNNLIVLS